MLLNHGAELPAQLSVTVSEHLVFVNIHIVARAFTTESQRLGEEVRADLRLATCISICSRIDYTSRQSQICAKAPWEEEEEQNPHRTIRLIPCFNTGTVKLMSRPTLHPVSFI